MCCSHCDDSRAIDAKELPGGRYLFRYYDGQDQRVVALEFDADFALSAKCVRSIPSGSATRNTSAQYCGH